MIEIFSILLTSYGSRHYDSFCEFRYYRYIVIAIHFTIINRSYIVLFPLQIF